MTKQEGLQKNQIQIEIEGNPITVSSSTLEEIEKIVDLDEKLFPTDHTEASISFLKEMNELNPFSCITFKDEKNNVIGYFVPLFLSAKGWDAINDGEKSILELTQDNEEIYNQKADDDLAFYLYFIQKLDRNSDINLGTVAIEALGEVIRTQYPDNIDILGASLLAATRQGSDVAREVYGMTYIKRNRTQDLYAFTIKSKEGRIRVELQESKNDKKPDYQLKDGETLITQTSKGTEIENPFICTYYMTRQRDNSHFWELFNRKKS